MGSVVSMLRRYVTRGLGCEEKTAKYKAMAANAKEAAFSSVLAKNWRKAALAFGEEAACALKLGDEVAAASALLRSAQCYNKLEDEDRDEEEVVAATRLALEKAFELFDKTDERPLAATCCLELAEFSIDLHELRRASFRFEQAADYYSSTRQSRYCMTQAKRLTALIANQETYPKSPIGLRFVKTNEETLIKSISY